MTMDVRPSPNLDRIALGPWRALGLLVLYFALQIAAALALRSLGMLPSFRQAAFAHPSASAALAEVLVLAALPILLLARYRWPARWPMAVLPGFGVCWPGWRWLGAGVLLALLMLPIVLGLNAALFPKQGVTQSVLAIFDQAHWWMRVLLTLLIVFLAPFVEELLFRGVLLAGFSERLPLRWAVALSVFLFAIAHLPDTGGHWQVLPGLVALAFGLVWLRLRSGSLLPGYVTHALYNAAVLTLALAPLLQGHAKA